MLNEKTKKGIIFGFLGGLAGFFLALFIFATSCALSFKAGWSGLSILPGGIILVGFIIASLILIIFTILRVKLRTKLYGFLFAMVFFLITYLISLRGKIHIGGHPVYPILILWIGAIISLLVLALFVIFGIKKGFDIANKEK